MADEDVCDPILPTTAAPSTTAPKPTTACKATASTSRKTNKSTATKPKRQPKNKPTTTGNKGELFSAIMHPNNEKQEIINYVYL